MKRFKLFANLMKEEAWINEQMSSGYECTNISPIGIYTFKKNSGASKIARIDYQNYMPHAKFHHYVAMHEDFGWQHLAGSRWTGSQYWIKDANGHDELFSDATSTIAYFKRLMTHSLFTAIWMILFMTLLSTENNLFAKFYSIKAQYLTPGLWDKEGSAFWFSFLFETPFAMMRFLIPWFFVISAVMFIYSFIQYRKHLKNLTE
ncbi:DUF2812 domain-containing protein [Solibacillus sp. FSL H8-0538]|uniref:DUF2812 domain-containing protein n=1 Tax=Solibacillus sp. FSL H8-0538 TaxID=2921400 RepID=UPI0030F77C8E